jgi:catechol 2,3-dioxygenase-like lactoylglutathione lyase family enzyme
VLELLSEPNRARAAYEAAARQPDYPEPLVALGHLLASNGRSAEARTFAARALALRPGMPGAETVLAMSDLDDCDFTGAERRVRRLIEAGPSHPQRLGAACKLLGDALHGQGRAEEAAEAYLQGNRLLIEDYLRRAGPAAVGAGRRPALRLHREMRDIDPAKWSARSRAQAPDAPAGGHAFLVGFPRSGTTLLGKIIGAHPQVLELEERPTLAAPLDVILTRAGELGRLADATEDELDQMRDLYWERVRQFVAAPISGRFVLDKMPLNVLLLPVIRRLFPAARVLFVVRDPRDVVLSCFRQRFRMTAAMAEFASLDQAARFYDAVMGLAQVYRERLPLDLHLHRHEALVADFEGRTRKILSFLGLEWDDAVHRFGDSGGQLVRTPSAPQVARGLYADGIGQWRAYAGPMQPALPILAPWVERFGYGDG